MLRKSDAVEIAKLHLERLSVPTGYRWLVTSPFRVATGWVFSYEYKCVDGTPPEDWEVLGGAPGFIIADDKSSRPLSWNEMTALQGASESDGPGD